MHDVHEERETESRTPSPYALASLAWSGWGSPVGLGILAVSFGVLTACLGLFLLCLHSAGLL
jgi:hypothetical protein